MSDILDDLRHPEALPWHVRQIQTSANAVQQIMAIAADEIERLEAALRDLYRLVNKARLARDKEALWKVFSTGEGARLLEQHAAAIRSSIDPGRSRRSDGDKEE